MPGVYIYTGDAVSESNLKQKLENYRNETEFDYDGEKGKLIDQVHDFSTHNNNLVCCRYSYDARIPYEYQGQTKFRTQTFDIHVKIILGDTVFYLIEKVKGSRVSITAQKISQLVYGQPKTIIALSLEPQLITEIESEDYRYLHGEGLKHITAKDSMMMLYGALAIRNDDGSEELSDTHQAYEQEDKGYTQYESLSTGFTVYLSAKKSTLTLTGNGANLDEVEKYFRSFIFPRI